MGTAAHSFSVKRGSPARGPSRRHRAVRRGGRMPARGPNLDNDWRDASIRVEECQRVPRAVSGSSERRNVMGPGRAWGRFVGSTMDGAPGPERNPPQSTVRWNRKTPLLAIGGSAHDQTITSSAGELRIRLSSSAGADACVHRKRGAVGQAAGWARGRRGATAWAPDPSREERRVPGRVARRAGRGGVGSGWGSWPGTDRERAPKRPCRDRPPPAATGRPGQA